MVKVQLSPRAELYLRKADVEKIVRLGINKARAHGIKPGMNFMNSFDYQGKHFAFHVNCFRDGRWEVDIVMGDEMNDTEPIDQNGNPLKPARDGQHRHGERP
jgi:hypothetical protein